MSASLTHAASSFSSQRSQRAAMGQLWWERAAQRRRLAELDDHMLADIGLSKAEAETEAKKPFWVA